MQQGGNALEGKRYADAIKAAIQLRGDDQACRDLLERAEEAQRRQVKADFARAMTAGQENMDAKKYDAAFASFTQALSLMPGDEQVASLCKEAEFQACAERGQKALATRSFGAAVTNLQRAASLKPADKAVAALLQQARDENQRVIRNQYDQCLNSGRSAYHSKRYNDAIRDLEKARQLMPLESEAAGLLTRAKADEAQFKSYLSQGTFALNAQQYDNAITHLTNAARLAPFGDSQVSSLLARARRRGK